jgi:hypothetical protein
MTGRLSGHRSSSLRDAGCIAAVCTILGRCPRRRSAQRPTPGTRCQYLWDLRRDRKSQSKGCPDRTYKQSNFPVCRQRISARVRRESCALCPQRRTSLWHAENYSIFWNLASRSLAVRARYFCNVKTFVYKRTTVLKKFSGVFDIPQ